MMQQEQHDQPGGRHDNDFADYRSIRTMPTQEQISCDIEPFLPHAPTEGQATTDAELLDRTFRLYHENVLGPMRETLQRIQKNDARELKYTLDHVRADSIAQRNQVGVGETVILRSIPLHPN